jgi:hypothetical protein
MSIFVVTGVAALALALIGVAVAMPGGARLARWVWLGQTVLMGVTTLGLVVYVSSDDPHRTLLSPVSRWEANPGSQGLTIAAVVCGGIAMIAALAVVVSAFTRRWPAAGALAVSSLALGLQGLAFIANAVGK